MGNQAELERLLAEIEYVREGALLREAKVFPRSQPIASDLGECTREYVLSIRHWQDRPPFEPFLVARLQRGRIIEETVLRELQQLGFKVRGERQPFELKDQKGRVILRGRVDGFIEWNHTSYPLEVKSLNPNVFQRLHSIDDMLKSPFMAKWPRQLWAYLFGHNEELGWFLVDDCLGHWRLLPVELDYGEMEKILQRCEQAVEHRDAETLPDYHHDLEVCRRCVWFGRICTPPGASAGFLITDNPELEAELDRRAELEPAYWEYQDLDETVKAAVKGKDGLVVGKWLVTGKEIRPRTLPPKPGYTPNPYWKSKFELLSVPQPSRGGPHPSQPPAEANAGESVKGEIAP